MTNLAQHAVSIDRAVETARCAIRKGVLRARLTIQPTPVSRIYTINIEYRPNGWPAVTVVDPILDIPPDEPSLPHVYKGNVLCLHLPDEWTPDQLMGDTIVPWAVEWLMYYELWLATDAVWLGGGHTTTRRNSGEPAPSN
jgi:hypothetical protein